MTESLTDDFLQVLDRIEDRMDQIYFLTLGGGKESRIVETVPGWRKDQCDAKCDFTEVPVPKKQLVRMGSLKVHPGVKAYVDAEEIPDLEDYEGTIPKDYLAIPPVTRLRKVYRPTPRINWTTEELKGLQRAAVAIIARDMGLATVCRMINPKLDWRFERREWLVQACLRLRDEEIEKVAKTLKFESPHNKDILADGPKPQSGGTKKPKSKAKSKKAAAKPKAKVKTKSKTKAKPKKVEPKPKPKAAAKPKKTESKPKTESEPKEAAKAAAKPKAKAKPKKKAPPKAKSAPKKPASSKSKSTPKKKPTPAPRKPSK
jgi:hypothetical protein